MSSILDSASEAAATASRRMSIILSPASMGSDGSGPRQESMVDSDEESEDDDDYMDNEDEELGEAQDGSSHEGPMMLKDWNSDGEWMPCFSILRRELLMVYASGGMTGIKTWTCWTLVMCVG